MNSDIKQKLFTNWHLRRWVALLAGGFFLLQAFRYWDALSALLGAILVFQAVTNSGCFGSQSCTVPSRQYSTSGNDDISNTAFTEINEE